MLLITLRRTEGIVDSDTDYQGNQNFGFSKGIVI